MSYQEKLSITNIVSSVVITGVYALIMLNRYNAGLMNDENIFRMWAIIFLIFIPITVVSKVIILVVSHVVQAVIVGAKGEDPEEAFDGTTDERDKLFDMKANQISLQIMTAGLLLAFATQLFDVSNHVFFITFFAIGFLADIIGELFKMKFYRRGI